VRWPVFEAGRLRAAVEVRSAEQEQALERYQKTVLVALGEVHDAIVELTNEQDRRRSLLAAVAANRDSAELLDSMYRQGLADFLAVLDAERSLYQSEDDLAQSQRGAASALVALYKALGGGWEVAESFPPAEPANKQGVASTQESR
jgi:outer membrane protein TolC